VLEGSWIGYGDPGPGFQSDFEPITRKEVALHAQRLRWLGQELAAIVRKLDSRTMAAKPAKGRAVLEIVRHVTNVEAEYGRTGGVGKPEGLKDLLREIEEGEGELPANITRLFDGVAAQFEAATPADLKARHQRGERLYTAKRGLRRALEHPWEHLREIERRLA
jgi:hypothetical protein